MNAEWYYLDKDNQKQGPFAKQEIIDKINLNELPTDVKVLSLKSEEWIQADQVFDLSNPDSKRNEIILETVPKDIQYQKVGGWLMFFCISLIVFQPFGAIIMILNILGQFYIPSSLKSYYLADGLIQIAMAFYAIYTGTQLMQIKPGAVDIAKKYLKVLFGVAAINLILPYVFGLPLLHTGDVTSDNFRFLISTAIYYWIWNSYLNKSERVKVTYDLY
ncbi:DUF2569 family protein [Bacteroidota bacterium]